MKTEKVKPEDLRNGDLILTVCLGRAEELAKVMCVDNGKVWTKSIVDQTEICETIQELTEEYLEIYKVY